MTFAALTSGTYQPTSFPPGAVLPAPAPSGGYGASLDLLSELLQDLAQVKPQLREPLLGNLDVDLFVAGTGKRNRLPPGFGHELAERDVFLE